MPWFQFEVHEAPYYSPIDIIFEETLFSSLFCKNLHLHSLWDFSSNSCTNYAVPAVDNSLDINYVDIYKKKILNMAKTELS